MPEHDFELYLSLLSRFLRLNPAQRDEIADELRDHLEQRLEELSSRGISREEAIRQALDEFGDAAELASHFTKATHIRRRRLIMRCTLGTVGALAATLLVATAFWPQGPHAPEAPSPRLGMAQEPEAVVPPAKAELAVVPSDDLRAQVATKLEARIDVLEMSERPLEEVIGMIGEQTGVDILFDEQSMTNEGIGLDQQVRKLPVTHTKLTARAALDLILEPLQLGYTIRDGLLLVRTQQKLSENLEIRVYNVRDLLVQPDREAAMAGGGAGARGGQFSVESALTAVAWAQIAQGFGGERRAQLEGVITTTVDPETWSEVGGPGSIIQYNGLAIINQTPAVHAKVEKLLEMMRKSLREPAAAKR